MLCKQREINIRKYRESLLVTIHSASIWSYNDAERVILRIGPWSSCHPSIPAVTWLSSGCSTTTLPLWHCQHLAVICTPLIIFLDGFSQAKLMGKPAGKVASHSGKLVTSSSAWKQPSLAQSHPGPISQVTHVPSPIHSSHPWPPLSITLHFPCLPASLWTAWDFLNPGNLHLTTATEIARIAAVKCCSHMVWLFLTASLSDGNSGHNLFYFIKFVCCSSCSQS